MAVTFLELIQLFQRAEKAEELLQKIWIEVGPYNQEKLSGETLRKLNDWFEFDDSE
jgi:hypothetical protein